MGACRWHDRKTFLVVRVRHSSIQHDILQHLKTCCGCPWITTARLATDWLDATQETMSIKAVLDAGRILCDDRRPRHFKPTRGYKDPHATTKPNNWHFSVIDFPGGTPQLSRHPCQPFRQTLFGTRQCCASVPEVNIFSIQRWRCLQQDDLLSDDIDLFGASDAKGHQPQIVVVWLASTWHLIRHGFAVGNRTITPRQQDSNTISSISAPLHSSSFIRCNIR